MSENTIDPEALTSPGTIDDPELEQRRAKEAAVREAESQSEDDTKFEQLRHEEELSRHEAAETVGDVPAPVDE